MAKRKKPRNRKIRQSRPQRAPGTPTAMEQLRQATTELVKGGRPEEAIAMLLEAVEAVLRENRNLQLRVKKLEREQVGKKSERSDPAQLSLMFEEFGESDESDDLDVERVSEEKEDAKLDAEIDREETATGKKRKPRKRHAWKGKGLEREEHLHELPPDQRGCAECGGTKDPMGEEVTHRLVFVPGHFVEEVHRCVKYACRKCREGSIPTAPAPPQVIERSVADATLLAHLVISKYTDHNPLTRLSGIYARTGVEIAVSTLADWVAHVGEQLAPLAEANEKRVFDSYILGTDATGIKVLDPNAPENVQRGTMWCYVGDRKIVVFRYTPTGEGATGPWSFLQGRKGYVQADAHSVYDRVFQGGIADATEIGCWFHARRPLKDLGDTDYRVSYPLILIRRLFRIEHLADLRKLEGEDRVAFRRERSQSVVDRIKAWAQLMKKQEPPDTTIARAASYMLNHWDALTRFLEDGEIHLDNNLVEQQNRSIALGRKNYLFCGSHKAAVRTARIYGILRTCALNDVPPLPYLTDVLRKLADGWPQSRIDELLPDIWLREHGELVESQSV